MHSRDTDEKPRAHLRADRLNDFDKNHGSRGPAYAIFFFSSVHQIHRALRVFNYSPFSEDGCSGHMLSDFFTETQCFVI